MKVFLQDSFIHQHMDAKISTSLESLQSVSDLFGILRDQSAQLPDDIVVTIDPFSTNTEPTVSKHWTRQDAGKLIYSAIRNATNFFSSDIASQFLTYNVDQTCTKLTPLVDKMNQNRTFQTHIRRAVRALVKSRYFCLRSTSTTSQKKAPNRLIFLGEFLAT